MLFLMTNGTIERFLESGALKLPAIIKPRLENRTAREVYDDYALLDFSLPEATIPLPGSL